MRIGNKLISVLREKD